MNVQLKNGQRIETKSHLLPAWTTALLALLALSLGGCADEETNQVGADLPTYPVEGTVYLDGEPMEGGAVVFVSRREDHDYTARADIDENGHYTLPDGAVVGFHSVRVFATDAELAESEADIKTAYDTWQSTAKLYEVEAIDNNVIDIEIETKPPYEGAEEPEKTASDDDTTPLEEDVAPKTSPDDEPKLVAPRTDQPEKDQPDDGKDGPKKAPPQDEPSDESPPQDGASQDAPATEQPEDQESSAAEDSGG